MKRFMTMLSLVVLGFAFTSCYDDSALWDSVKDLEGKVKSLETLCNETNSNLASLQALVTSIKQGDYIVDVTPLTENGKEVGYQITFHDRGAVKIYHGKDGVNASDVPEFGAKQDTDGNYYWTVNGEWVKDDNGNKIPVVASSGVTPMLKVEDGRWYASYDEGKTWKDVGSAGSEGGSGCIFKDVKFADGNLTLTMSDGSVFVIPVGERFSIVLGDFDASSIQYGSDVVIPYSITGAKGEVSIFVLTDGWIFDTELVEDTPLSGKLTISQDDDYDEEVNGKVAIFAAAEDGTTVSKIIRLSSGVLYPTNANYDDTYTVSAEAGQIEFTVSTNRTVEVNTNADWITYADTKAVEEKTLVFDIKENDGARRKTNVEIASGKVNFGFTVVQKGFGEAFAVDVTRNEVLGSSWLVNIDTLYNKAGQKVYEVLGYSSWEEVALAAGEGETLHNRKGEVTLLAYDLYTGEALPYDEKSQYGLGFRHNADGSLASYDSDYATYWDWYTTWTENGSYLSPQFNVFVNQVNPGNTYSFGILLTSPEGEARIEVNITVEEYKDPEKGLYDNPAAPGTYEFTICDTLNVDNAQMQFLFNNSIAEDIKSTLGMTAYEIYKKYQEYSINTEFEFKDGYAYGRDGNGIDINGYGVGWGKESSVANVSWSFSATGMSVAMFFNVLAWGNPLVFTQAIYDAVGKTVSYKYIITYNDYKLIFTHEIFFEGEIKDTNYCLEINNPIAGDLWNSQVVYMLDEPMKANTKYEFKYQAKATSDHASTPVFLQAEDGIQNYKHALPGITTEWRGFSVIFTTDDLAYNSFLINVGDFVGTICLDNVSLKEVGSDVEMIRNGDFEEGTDGWNWWGSLTCYRSEYSDENTGKTPVVDARFDYSTFPSWYYWNSRPEGGGQTIEIVDGILTINNPSITENFWDFQYHVADGISWVAGRTYEVKMKIRASQSSSFRMSIGMWSSQKSNIVVDVDTEWKEFSVEYTPDVDGDGFVMFQSGDVTGTIELQWLEVTHKE